MKIVYLDRHLAVVEKEFGEISELPEKAEPNTFYTPLLLREELMRGGESSDLFTVHRLDRTTAGLMVFARTAKSAAALSKQIQDGALEKIYLAAVPGTPAELTGEMRDFLFFDRKKGKSFVADKKRSGTKEAILRYELAERLESRFGEISIFRVALMTGRTHQIRVQFASRGLPLLGDGKYGSRINYKGCALFSAELRFVHPQTGEKLNFTADPCWNME